MSDAFDRVMRENRAMRCNSCETRDACTVLGYCQNRINKAVDAVAPDRVSEAVRSDLLRRSVHGWRKYGAGLDTNPAPLADALKHAYEEALDLATYLKWSILKLEGSDLLAPDQSRGSGLGTKVSPVRRCQGGAVGVDGMCLACFAAQGEACLSPAADVAR